VLVLDLAAKGCSCYFESFWNVVSRNMLKWAITATRPSSGSHIDGGQFVLPSIGATTVDLLIIVSNDIEIVHTELMLIWSKHLCHYDIVRSTGHLSTPCRDLLAPNSMLFKGTRSRTRPNRSYIKSCMYRSPNSSLLKGGGRGGGGPEKTSMVGHFGCRCGLLVVWMKRKKIWNLAIM
jgi:hypothetical protein